MFGRTFARDEFLKLGAIFLAAADNVAAKLVCARKLIISHG